MTEKGDKMKNENLRIKERKEVIDKIEAAYGAYTLYVNSYSPIGWNGNMNSFTRILEDIARNDKEQSNG